MDKHRKRWMLVIMAGVLLLLVQVVYGALEPGSAEDPLVTLSLVEQKIEQLKFYIDENLKNLSAGSSGAGEGEILQVVELNPGEILLGKEGSEIILRSGRSTAVDSPLGGLADVTGAKDLISGTVIPANHLLIVPRGDGRGVKAETTTFLMVRGGYTIVKQ